MKTYRIAGVLILITVFAFWGCSSFPSPIKSSSTGSSPSSQKTDEGLYTKVPASMRADVKEAEFDLTKTTKRAELAQEEVKLAELRKEQALLESEYAKYSEKYWDIRRRKAAVFVDTQKMEAIDKSGLGDKEDNINNIANLQTKGLEIETDAIKVKAEMDTLTLRIKKLGKEIASQEKKIAAMTSPKRPKPAAKPKKKRKKK